VHVNVPRPESPRRMIEANDQMIRAQHSLEQACPQEQRSEHRIGQKDQDDRNGPNGSSMPQGSFRTGRHRGSIASALPRLPRMLRRPPVKVRHMIGEPCANRPRMIARRRLGMRGHATTNAQLAPAGTGERVARPEGRCTRFPSAHALATPNRLAPYGMSIDAGVIQRCWGTFSSGLYSGAQS
jgi:hypothetical protein